MNSWYFNIFKASHSLFLFFVLFFPVINFVSLIFNIMFFLWLPRNSRKRKLWIWLLFLKIFISLIVIVIVIKYCYHGSHYCSLLFLKESYCEALHRFKEELSKPFDEATIFLTGIESQLNNLCKGTLTQTFDYRPGIVFFFFFFYCEIYYRSGVILFSTEADIWLIWLFPFYRISLFCDHLYNGSNSSVLRFYRCWSFSLQIKHS